jgi:hypothetical protein
MECEYRRWRDKGTHLKGRVKEVESMFAEVRDLVFTILIRT